MVKVILKFTDITSVSVCCSIESPGWCDYSFILISPGWAQPLASLLRQSAPISSSIDLKIIKAKGNVFYGQPLCENLLPLFCDFNYQLFTVIMLKSSTGSSCTKKCVYSCIDGVLFKSLSFIMYLQ